VAEQAKIATHKLSLQQKTILVCVLRGLKFMRERAAANKDRAWELLWGVPIRWLRPRDDYYSAADRAAFSRSLRRLEQRGLIHRTNDISVDPKRTTRIKLTDTGEKLAETLAKDWPQRQTKAING
jgi:hypothetical protein